RGADRLGRCSSVCRACEPRACVPAKRLKMARGGEGRVRQSSTEAEPMSALAKTPTMFLLFCAAVVVIAPEGHQAAAQRKLKVGVLHLGSINDAGYNQAHAEGVQIMKANLPDVEVIEVENVPEGADAERVMENMIKQGAKLIIPASFGYLEPALR